ncbi:reticulon-4 receptor-like 2 [Melopsittacus undulatus]|uniref:reticulon-4 receptor-like 2 n=1 Tax=Melopsittacus undulatus TaxID=13146 RepID=UPI00146ADD45|nr:reticulon-4 receptor-like 2 [Melopsittacus undulatus]
MRPPTARDLPQGGRLAALLLALVWVPGGAPACPALCTCYVSPPTVSCQANNFSSVPAGLPPGARRLFLQNNVIGALRAGTFGPSTVTLWLYSNNISSIQPGTFRHLPALEELDLGDNPHLRVLAPDTFHGLRRLQALHLYRCQLATLPSAIFRGLHSLQYLYLQENGLLYLQDDLFADLANLSHLFLHGNRVRALSEGVFRGLLSLDRLLLHANRLVTIHRRAFRGLSRLTILYLFNNSLTALPGDPLAALPALQFLRLNANPWACDCRARPLWAWFRRTRVSSSAVPCASPPQRRGTDLRHLRARDFDACPDSDDDDEEQEQAREEDDGDGVGSVGNGGGRGGGVVAVMGTPGRALGRPGTLPAAPPSAFYRDGLPPHDLRGPQLRPPPPSRDSRGPPVASGCPEAPCTPPAAAAVPRQPHVLLPLLGLLLPWL